MVKGRIYPCCLPWPLTYSKRSLIDMIFWFPCVKTICRCWISDSTSDLLQGPISTIKSEISSELTDPTPFCPPVCSEISCSHIHHASLNLSIRVQITNPQYALMQNFLFQLITNLSHYLVPQRHRISVTQLPLYGLEQIWGWGIWGPLHQTTNTGYFRVHVTLRKTTTKKRFFLFKKMLHGLGWGLGGGWRENVREWAEALRD